MRPRQPESGRRFGGLAALSAFVLLADDGSAFAQSSGASRELPPVQVSSDEAPRRKKPAISRRASKPIQPGSRVVASPAATQVTDARSVASGAKRPPSMASEITISGEEINARPFARPGEALEAVPGLIVTQHSGDGEANQYFLCGYNLTMVAISRSARSQRSCEGGTSCRLRKKIEMLFAHLTNLWIERSR